MAGHDLCLHLLGGYALEKALVMTAPGAQHPVLSVHVLEHVNYLAFITVVEMNGCLNL